MKHYPSIPHFSDKHLGKPCIAFKKYDGSNLRFEYSKKRGWWKFGTRNHLFCASDLEYGVAIDIFMELYANQIIAAIKEDKFCRNTENMVVFAEFFGPHSFSGQHVPNDTKELVLFDVNIHKRGVLGPVEFIKLFGHLKIAEVIYRGLYSQEFIEDVRNGVYPVVEGVVVKGGKGHQLWFEKIKTNSYKQKLQEFYSGEWQKYW